VAFDGSSQQPMWFARTPAKNSVLGELTPLSHREATAGCDAGLASLSGWLNPAADVAVLEVPARKQGTLNVLDLVSGQVPPFSMAAHLYCRGRASTWPGAAIACRIRWR
jgi:hypothetical protein